MLVLNSDKRMLQLWRAVNFLSRLLWVRLDQLLENLNFSEQIQEIISLNNLVTIKETEEVAKKRKWFHEENTRPKWFYQMLPEFQGAYHLNFIWTFPGNRKEEMLPKSFYKMCITLIIKPVRNIMREKNYRSTSVMNIEVKTL